MKKSILLLCAISLIFVVEAQDVQSLQHFDRIVVSPKVELELTQGDSESIQLEVSGVEERRVNVEVINGTLRIYLDEAKMVIKPIRGYYDDDYWEGQMYDRHVKVHARVTYQTLRELQIRGEERIVVHSPISYDGEFVLKAYGASNIRLAGIQADRFRASLIGENKLHIEAGNLDWQKLKSIGENEIDVRAVSTGTTRANAIGENTMTVHAYDYLKVNSIGGSEVLYEGHPLYQKGLQIGETEVESLDWH